MALVRPPPSLSILSLFSVLILLLSFTTNVAARDTRWIQYTGNDGTILLDDDRRPSLYTGPFGDCAGESSIDITRFDAAYYKDNMTVMFHLGGRSLVANETLMSTFTKTNSI